MHRRVAVVVAVLASSTYFACGGGTEAQKPAVAPVPEPTAPATAASAPEPVASAAPVSVGGASTEPEAKPSEPPAPKSLYERLGGKDAITKIVRESLKNVTTDKRLAKYFGKTAKDPKKMEALETSLIDLLCARTGGPCEYHGKEMKSAHEGMKIKESDYEIFVEDVTAALDSVGVAKPEQDELRQALASMKDEIVSAKK